MTTGLSKIERTYDPKTKPMNTSMESPAPDGSMMKMRSTAEWKDDDSRVSTMYASSRVRSPDSGWARAAPYRLQAGEQDRRQRADGVCSALCALSRWLRWSE
jgi:hypothetical protein